MPPFEGERHVYRPTLGEGVFQIPVGPVHAGIIEPGHFNFAVAGEPILYLQLRMFYMHKGIEKLFEQLPMHQRRVPGREHLRRFQLFARHGVLPGGGAAADVEIPRARTMDAHHSAGDWSASTTTSADIGAIATDVGFVIANAHASRLREMHPGHLNEELTGSRLLRGMVCLGGVRRAWDVRSGSARLSTNSRRLRTRSSTDLMDMIESSDSTRDRLERTGILHPDKARDLGIVGVGGRASGIDLDVRRDHPYAAYDPR